MKFSSRRFFRLWAAGCVLFATTAAIAEEKVVEFDPAKTRVEFTLGDVLHLVHGTFQLKSGEIRFDPATGAASGAILIDATSGDSGSKARDKKMHKDILESGRYPDISFLPKKIIGTVSPQGASRVQIQGIFRMHGSDHDLTIILPVQINGNELSATTQFQVPYTAWGLKNPSTFILRVSDKVNIGILASGHFVAGKTPPRK